MRDFLVRVIGARQVPRTGHVLSAGFSLAAGALTDVKADVCAHCLPRPAEAWLALIDALADGHGLAAPGGGEPLRGRHADLAFLGLGLNVELEPRLNVYLRVRPRIGEVASRTGEAS